MKKISLFVLISFFSISFMMAQNYDELLAKGKSYEGKNQFAYALGYYYDAMNVENAGPEAKEKFDVLKSEIENGNPGYGEFSLLTMQKGWTALFKDYYRYFTEFSPLDIYFYKLELGKLDYETETAEYLLPYVYVPSEKYKTIKSILMTGVEKNGRDDWGDLKQGLVPYIEKKSFIEKKDADSIVKRVYNEDKIALSGKYVSNLFGKYFFEYDGAACFTSYRILELANGAIIIDGGLYNDYGQSGNYYENFSMYDIQFDIYDVDGNLLLSGSRQNNGYITRDGNPESIKNNQDERKYIFIDKGAKILSQVEKNKKLIIKPRAVFLNYGCLIDDGNYDLLYKKNEKRTWDRKIFKPLYDMQINLNNVSIIDYYKRLDDIELARQKKEAELKTAREEAERMEREREEKLKQEQLARLNDFINTGVISVESAAEVIRGLTDTIPKIIKITGDIQGEWSDINAALDLITSSVCFKLDLSEIHGITTFPQLSCMSIDSLVLPEDCTRISTKAFINSPNITTIYIPKTVIVIADSAFANCKSLETVYYSGSKKEWKCINVLKNNKPLQKAEIIYE